MGFSSSFRGLRAFLMSPANVGRLAESKPVARELVLLLIGCGGSARLSEMEFARRLGRSASAVASNLAWLESEGALVVTLNSSGGLRLASDRSLNLQACFALFARVLGRAVQSVASVLRSLRARAKVRANRLRPDARHTPDPMAERYKQDIFSIGEAVQPPEKDASQRLSDRAGLSVVQVAALVSQVALEMGCTEAQIAACYGIAA